MDPPAKGNSSHMLVREMTLLIRDVVKGALALATRPA